MSKTTLEYIHVLRERIAALEVELKASRGWWERLRVAEARIAALEAAARAVVVIAPFDEHHAALAALAALLDGDA